MARRRRLRRPTAAALPCRLSVVASDLALADLAMTVLAANAPARAWPADVRFAAPPDPVVGVAVDGCSRAVLNAVTAALSPRARVSSPWSSTKPACTPSPTDWTW